LCASPATVWYDSFDGPESVQEQYLEYKAGSPGGKRTDREALPAELAPASTAGAVFDDGLLHAGRSFHAMTRGAGEEADVGGEKPSQERLGERPHSHRARQHDPVPGEIGGSVVMTAFVECRLIVHDALRSLCNCH
jgi:hypothetical protein